MMRGMVPALGTPYPIGTLLPAVMQEDPVTMLLTEALDDVLAPAIAALDCLHAYLDPGLAPPDFLEWLAGWVGVELDENWPPDRQRAVVAAAVELHRMRGTAAGVRDYLGLVTGGSVEITDSGGTAWSETPDAALPGDAVPRVRVRVVLPAGSTISSAVIEDLVAAAKPVHVAHQVTLITDGVS
jgi:phage tail-like protein